MADYSKDLFDYKYECRRNCSAFDDGYNQALEDFYKALEKNQQDNWIDNLEYGITFADVEEVIRQLKK